MAEPYIIPFSIQWHDDEDLMGHCEMPYNAEGRGPEMDPGKVVLIQCWCWRGAKCTVFPLRIPDSCGDSG